MHIVSTTDRRIYFVPREHAASVSVKITDEQTNTSTTYSTYAAITGNFSEITLNELSEETFYFLELSSNADDQEIYRGKVFCTNQTDLEKYTVNQGQYTSYEKANANEYITI